MSQHPQYRRIAPLALLALLALLSATAPAQRRPRTTGAVVGTVEHVWKPVRDGGAEVTAIEVRTVVQLQSDSVVQAFSLNAPITYAGVAGIADRVRNFEVTDALGTVPLRIENDAPNAGGFPFYRHWRAERAVRFPLTIAYRSLAPDKALREPPFGLFATAGGVSGAGSGFLVLPETPARVTTRVHWDLSDLAAGSSGVTSFGDGDVQLDGPADGVRQGWIMAGPLGKYPAQGGGAGFSAVWLGTPAWDPEPEMRWTATMYEYLGKNYRYLNPLPSYRVFVRVGAQGGTALGASFMGGAAARQPGAAPQGQSPRETFTHEMGHLFVGAVRAPDGISSWFSEGLNTYYTRLLPMRGGFTSVDDYGKDINRAFREYYDGSARNFSADSITRVGFTDNTIRHMPYVRSSLYFADLDSRIRAHSRGARNLDAVLQELFVRRASGTAFDHAAWIEIVVREAGAEAAAMFQNIIIAGTQTLVPASDAFGPCFERRDVAAQVADGKETRRAGYAWVRVPGRSDEQCRASW